MRYKRGVASWHADRGQACEGKAASKGGRALERGETVSLTNIEVSETSVRPRAPFVAAHGKKVPSLNLSKCLYFSLASIFPREPRPIPPLYASNAAIFLTCPQNDILAHSPFNIFSCAPTLPFALLSRLLVLVMYILYISVTRTHATVSYFSPILVMRAHLWCTCMSTQLLELRVTKMLWLLCMYAGIQCRGGRRYSLFHLNPPWCCLGALECFGSISHSRLNYTTVSCFCEFPGFFITARRFEVTECAYFINIITKIIKRILFIQIYNFELTLLCKMQC